MRLALATLLLAAAPTIGAPPKVPAGPVIAEVGKAPQVVAIEVPAEFGCAPAFAPEDCLLFPGETDKSGVKKYLVIPYKPGVYRVVFWTKGEVEFATLVIDATGGKPQPGPGPTPVPVPSSGLTKLSKDSLASVADKTHQADLAKQLRALASKVAAGSYPSNAAILAAYKATFNSSLPLDALERQLLNWKPWYDAVIGELGRQYSAGKLSTNAAWADAFNQLAEGLGG